MKKSILPSILKYIQSDHQLRQSYSKLCQLLKSELLEIWSKIWTGTRTFSFEWSIFWSTDLSSACSPTYSEIFFDRMLDSLSLPSMTFWRHLVIYFNTFMLRNVSKLVKSRFFQVCPEYRLANTSRYFSHRADRYTPNSLNSWANMDSNWWLRLSPWLHLHCLKLALNISMSITVVNYSLY